MSILATKLRRDLRRNRAQFIAITITIFLGITLFGGSYDAYRSLEASYEQVFDDLSFADLWVSGGDVEGFAAEAAAVPGVAAVEVRRRADVGLQPVPGHALFGRIVGVPVGSRVNTLMLLDGAPLDPARPDEVLVEQHMAEHFSIDIGDRLEAAAPDGWRPLTVVGIAASAEYLWPSPSRQQIIASMDDFGVVFSTDAAAAEIGGGGTITQALIRYEPDADRASLDAELQEAARRAGATDSFTRAEQPSNSALQADVQGFGELSFMFPLLFLTAAGLGTWVMLTRLVITQLGVIGILTANGMSRRKVFGHYLTYGVVVGLAGAIPGVIAGVLMAWGVAGRYTAAIDVPVTVLAIGVTTPIAGILFGVLTGLVAAAFPAWRAIRLTPAEAMRGSAPTGIARPTLVERVVPPLGRLPAGGALVLRGIFRNARRTLTTMLGVVLALTLILVSWGMIDTVEVLLDRQFVQIQQSDAEVVFDRVPDAALLEAVAGVPGVAASEPTVQASVTVESEGGRYATSLVGYRQGTTMHRFLDTDGPVDLPGEGVLLGSHLEGMLGVSAGDVVILRLPAAGVVQPALVAGFVDEPLGTYAYTSLAYLERLVGAAPTASGADAAGVVFGAAVRFDPGADPSVMRNELQHVDGVIAVAGTRAFEQTLRSFMGLFYAFIGIMLLFGGALAFGIVFNTMSVNIAERTVEVATMRAAGMTEKRVARLITAENLIVTLLGVVPGLLIGYLTAMEFMAAYDSDQFDFTLSMKPTTLLLSALFILAVTLLSQRPGLRAVRRLDIARVVRERAV
jgi:putative ABC transport system permease protein